MDEKKLYNAITRIDGDLIDRSLNRASLKPGSHAARFRFGLLAACLALFFIGAAVLVLYTRPWNDVIHAPDSNTSTVSVLKSGTSLTGRTSLVYGGASPVNEGMASRLAPGFYIRAVLEAEVVEVLPDTYVFAGSDRPSRVAKLHILDQIRGDGFPVEIYLRYSGFDASVFDGYERFILSVEQVGVENYALINETQGRIDFFPNMFDVYQGDLGYGSVIAFRNGRADDSFWRKTSAVSSRSQSENDLLRKLWDTPESSGFPAARREAIGQVKQNILKLAADRENERVSTGGYRFVTADDLFVTPEAKTTRAYLEPGEDRVFFHFLTWSGDRVEADYRRVINGFPTDETIRITGGEKGGVSRSPAVYDEASLAALPDLGTAMESLRLSELTPPHVEVPEGMTLVYSGASGRYRNVNGTVYGIIRVLWSYRSAERPNEFLTDDMYVLYDGTGQRSLIEREELRDILGSDPFLLTIPYGTVIGISY